MIAKSRLSLVMIGASATEPSGLLGGLQQSANLFPQFRVVGMTMTSDGVIHGSVEHFVFGAFES